MSYSARNLPELYMNRAYSLMTLKAVDEDQRILTGIATTPAPDRADDIMVPEGAKFTLPMPFLWQHEHDEPIGHVIDAKVTPEGIAVKVQIASVAEEGNLKDRLDEAWQSIKAGLVKGLSIGFRGIETAQIEGSWGIKFLQWDWFELSAVTVPCNIDASITSVKSADRKQLAALGKSVAPVVRLAKPAGASATVVKKIPKVPKPLEGNMKINEQIKSFRDALAQKSARQLELMTAAEGRTLDAAESEEFDTLSDELAATETHIKRLELMSKSNAAAAVAVTDDSGMRKPLGHISVKATNQVAKGTAFTRYVIAQCRAKGNLVQAAEIAKQWHDTTPEVAEVLKAAVAAGTTTDATWAASLVPYQNLTSEFIELLRPETIVGKLTQLRAVPFNVRIPGQTQGSTVAWVGETAPKPVSALGFADITLRFNKLAGIVVISDELARLSTPSAEAIIQGDLTAQIAQFMDDSFINPTYAAVGDVRPASVTNGVTPIAATGTDAESLREDIRAAYSTFIQANMSVAGATWIMTSTQAMAIGMMMNPLGQPEFPGIGATGGTLIGLPVIVSETVPSDSSGSIMVLVKQSEILLADEGGVTIDVSREASVQMNSTPDNPSTASTVLTSLWANNLVGIRCERLITWKKRRPQAVAYISNAAYGS
jgi:HK97 family phage major capsid protein/HK97 family phage prohead protease